MAYSTKEIRGLSLAYTPVLTVENQACNREDRDNQQFHNPELLNYRVLPQTHSRITTQGFLHVQDGRLRDNVGLLSALGQDTRV
ncbi:Allantoate permease [Fusarium oxysporum f. sp. albedinis]|nr:Allantoate permease [Fusarium oxysporum f. sp. albedinis]